MGSSQGGGWSAALGSISELRLQKAREALDAGEVEQAIVEAEELLDDEPDHLRALAVVGEGALDLGDFPLAESAWARALELAPDDPAARCGVGVSRFELTDLEGAVQSLRSALDADAERAEAWYYLGLALERLGQGDDARAALARAAALQAELYPIVEPFPDALWTRSLERAWGFLPALLRAWFQDVQLELRELPDLEQLRRSDPPLSPTSAALYQGEPPDLPEESWHRKPERVLLFKSNLERIATLEQIPLARLIAEALRLEALDWLSLGPEDHPIEDG